MKLTPRSTASTLAMAMAAAVAAALITPIASAQINVYLGTAPPPTRYEVRPNAPGQGYSWLPGYWQPVGGRYRWHPGLWQQPPYAGAYYVHPHYDHYNEGWRMHDGYWSKEDHDDHYFDNNRDKHQEKREEKRDKKDDRRDNREDDHRGHGNH